MNKLNCGGGSFMKVKIMHEQSGMTLIELLIVLFIALLVIAGSYSIFGLVIRGYNITDEKSSEFEKMRNIASVIGRDIRQGSVPAEGSEPVDIQGSDDELYIFYYNENEDEYWSIKYFMDDDQLEKQVLSPNNRFPDDIDNDDYIIEDTRIVISEVHSVEYEEESNGDRRIIEITIQLEEDGEEKTFEYLTRSGGPPE